jgi:hypothetical protein
LKYDGVSEYVSALDRLKCFEGSFLYEFRLNNRKLFFGRRAYWTSPEHCKQVLPIIEIKPMEGLSSMIAQPDYAELKNLLVLERVDAEQGITIDP